MIVLIQSEHLLLTFKRFDEREDDTEEIKVF